MSQRFAVTGAGLGLRRGLLADILAMDSSAVDFLELTPENWIGIGGRRGGQLRAASERFPLVAHGLSLSLGGPDPLDQTFIATLKTFLDQHAVRCFSEHLSYCSAGGHLYDLMPLPFTDDAVRYVAARIRRVQDMLERRIAVENISYYVAPYQQLSEIDFINAVIAEADCDLLLDINNIVVNSVNHGYCARAFLEQLPLQRVAYVHIAGHEVRAADLRIDTHGSPVGDEAWDLLALLYQQAGAMPTLLERDFNYPPFAQLLAEVAHIRQLQVTSDV